MRSSRGISGKTVRFGGLHGKLAYDDATFDVDPEIQAMFYGNEASPGHHGQRGGSNRAHF
jgi:hypothetical protein